jgi:hypothetical protein
MSGLELKIHHQVYTKLINPGLNVKRYRTEYVEKNVSFCIEIAYFNRKLVIIRYIYIC